jgi:hypothetical protein
LHLLVQHAINVPFRAREDHWFFRRRCQYLSAPEVRTTRLASTRRAPQRVVNGTAGA